MAAAAVAVAAVAVAAVAVAADAAAGADAAGVVAASRGADAVLGAEPERRISYVTNVNISRIGSFDPAVLLLVCRGCWR